MSNLIRYVCACFSGLWRERERGYCEMMRRFCPKRCVPYQLLPNTRSRSHHLLPLTSLSLNSESSALAAPTESVDLHARFRDLVAATTYPPSAAGPAPAATTTMPTTTSTSTEELFRNLMAGLPGGSRSPPTPDHPGSSFPLLFLPS